LKFDLKKFLKQIKLNEESISMVLGAIVVVIVGILVVNYFKDKTNGSISTNATQTSAIKEHVVVKGETLWSIAEDSFGSGYNWVDIKSANKLKTETIDVGQKLVIPEVSPKQPTITSKGNVTISQGSLSITGDSYTVVKGDSLWNIAVRAYGDGFKWTEIAKANKLVNPGIIHVGNVLSLPR
jgi:nucleoid-associated protein YgaU